jgi:chaperonin cofactor prefoldin
MAMETVLKKLESRIEELVAAYQQATSRTTELESRVAELEQQAAASGDAADRVAALEEQREKLAARLEGVLSSIDAALGEADAG